MNSLGGSVAKQYFETAAKKVEGLTPREVAQRRIDTLNREHDYQDKTEYDCKLCDNRGWTAQLSERNGYFYEQCPECRCMGIRRSIWRMKQSGLEKTIREKTFDRFTATEPWQRTMLDLARRYVSEGIGAGYWFFAGGQPGSGKTHLCTAIARQILYDRPLYYMVWDTESKRLKAIVNEVEDYAREMDKLKSIEVLYIDDLFKPVPDEKTGGKKLPTGPDVKLAFEIINYRSINKLPTIVSSEWFMNELADIDEATASRIAEFAGPYQLTIGRDRTKNHRFSNQTVL